MKKTLIVAITVLSSALSFAQTWNQIAVPTTEKLNDIEFASNTVGYISGDNETLLKTTDGGENWTAINPIGIIVGFTYNIGDLEFISETVGFCNIPNAGQTYKTTDGGINWTLIDDAELGNFCYRNAIYALAEDHFFLGGAGCFQSAMFKEFDTAVWSEKADELENFNASEHVQQIDFYNQLGIAATNSVYMLRTVDGGQNWDTIPTPISPTGTLTSVAIVDPLNMVAGYDDNGSGFGILRSNDAGLTWTEDLNSATFYYPSYLSVAVATNGDIYSGAKPSSLPNGLMFESEDGVNWIYEEVDQPIVAIDSYGSDMTFAVGDSGYVITNFDFTSVGLEEEAQIQSSLFPNPTNDVVHIKSEAPFRLEVLDTYGRVVFEDESWSNEKNSNLETFSPGVYQFVLNYEDSRSVKRIVKN